MTDPNNSTALPLDELPNLGKTTVMWLRAVGIRDSQTLRDRGIFWAYERMRARGFRVTTAVLFSLEGALQDRPWRSFSDAEKDHLLTELAQTAAMAEQAPALPKAAPKRPASSQAQNRAGPARAARKPSRQKPSLTQERSSKQER